MKVWAIICDFLGDMSEPRRGELVGWLYDDMCHLKPFSGILILFFPLSGSISISHLENVKQDQSEMTKVFAQLTKAVDKLHFRGHRGSYCHENCDPNAIKELEGVNTPVCEQTFAWLNKFRNCRNMNEARFCFYFYCLGLAP